MNHTSKDREQKKADLVILAPNLLKACEQAIDLIQWMSGAPAFGPDGEAHQGWCRAQERIRYIRNIIAKAKGKQPFTCAIAELQKAMAGPWLEALDRAIFLVQADTRYQWVFRRGKLQRKLRWLPRRWGAWLSERWPRRWLPR